jgi:hypothetical protein
VAENILDDPEGLGFTCGLCGKGFGANKKHCKRHIINFHSANKATLGFDFCNKTYKNYDSLRHHQRTQHGLYKQN